VCPNQLHASQFPSFKNLSHDRKRIVSPQESEYSELTDGEKSMTLCIGAACQFKGDPALVMVSDTRSLSTSRDWGLSISSENADKLREIGKFCALVAGDPTEADGLLAYCTEAIEKFSVKEPGPESDLYYNDFFRGLRTGAGVRMKEYKITLLR
jgi:hypothetical protein